jgi:hypothetical protein
MSTSHPAGISHLSDRESFLAMLGPAETAYLCGLLSISLHPDVLRVAIERVKKECLTENADRHLQNLFAMLAGYLSGVVSPEVWKEAVDRCAIVFKIKVAK